MQAEHTCQRCAAPFTRRTDGGKCQIYCGNCKTKRVTPLRDCGRCGEPYHPPKNGRGTWCSTCREQGCVVPGCGKPLRSIPYCEMHHHRVKRHGDPGSAKAVQRPFGTGGIDKMGYRQVTRDGHRMAEHRFVMQDMIGRPLAENESVHHKNGVRHDNRPENLELWVTESKTHRKGQRVEDLVAWVVETYPEYVEAALSNRPQLRLVS